MRRGAGFPWSEIFRILAPPTPIGGGQSPTAPVLSLPPSVFQGGAITSAPAGPIITIAPPTPIYVNGQPVQVGVPILISTSVNGGPPVLATPASPTTLMTSAKPAPAAAAPWLTTKTVAVAGGGLAALAAAFAIAKSFI